MSRDRRGPLGGGTTPATEGATQGAAEPCSVTREHLLPARSRHRWSRGLRPLEELAAERRIPSPPLSVRWLCLTDWRTRPPTTCSPLCAHSGTSLAGCA